MWLFFGCRRRDQDFLYRRELEAAAAKGRLPLFLRPVPAPHPHLAFHPHSHTGEAREGEERREVDRGFVHAGSHAIWTVRQEEEEEKEKEKGREGRGEGGCM